MPETVKLCVEKFTGFLRLPIKSNKYKIFGGNTLALTPSYQELKYLPKDWKVKECEVNMCQRKDTSRPLIFSFQLVSQSPPFAPNRFSRLSQRSCCALSPTIWPCSLILAAAAALWTSCWLRKSWNCTLQCNAVQLV